MYIINNGRVEVRKWLSSAILSVSYLTKETWNNSLNPKRIQGEQGWRSGESTRLPPMWPGFKSRCRRHMWVEFVVSSLPCSERFFSGYVGFLLSLKTNTYKFQFDLESGHVSTSSHEVLSASWVNKLLQFINGFFVNTKLFVIFCCDKLWGQSWTFDLSVRSCGWPVSTYLLSINWSPNQSLGQSNQPGSQLVN